MKLRLLAPDDEAAATAAHAELLRENFEFLLAYRTGMEWLDYLAQTEDARFGRNLPEGWVPATFLVADVDGGLVGRASIRHELNQHLFEVGGHIGYAVRPQFRGRGYATEMLRLALGEARSLGIATALLTCDPDNFASHAVIERNGGVREVNSAPISQDKLRYWIPT
ncbi:GNAT family N-acetyltransferase [Arthrobacter sp. JZ12]|uniref:GNAT family N-acetyltransferase n=1 Tax=Arthrobacter sp. JZ12 TaxID=2654190 RepID=UPI002B483333|nr:GNAT family N-acetyltransferase [Arthrobacter sp. JZ12]WRH26171.1 GNAT family N-acetyltransferase [Arthrobacter sp. JZ12]